VTSVTEEVTKGGGVIERGAEETVVGKFDWLSISEPKRRKVMKTLLRLLILCMVVASLAGCGSAATTEEEIPVEAGGVAVPTAAEEETLTAAEEWAKENHLGPWAPETEDWAAIEAAAKEEGEVVVYSNSSKIEKLIEPWSALYPEIKLSGGDTDDIAVKMNAEQEAGNVVGDVWFNSDGHLLYGEFVPNQWMWWYMPPELTGSDITPDRPFAIARRSVDVIGYNQEINPDGCPLTNWWQLTEPELKGKFYMEDPISDSSTTAKIALIVQHADEMAEAYEALYGKEWTTDEAYGDDTPNAGYLFLKRLARNQPGIQPGGDEVDAAFATLGMDSSVEPGYGWTGLSSYEATMEGELAMAPCYGLEPTVGILKASYLGIANKAPHPNAAKLFIRFALSEEGFDPWNQMGAYPGVDGLPIAEGMPPRNEIKLWPSDDLFAYQNLSQIRDFWALSFLAP
jgi:iron(III) transport system substrate-binding protein